MELGSAGVTALPFPPLVVKPLLGSGVGGVQMPRMDMTPRERYPLLLARKRLWLRLERAPPPLPPGSARHVWAPPS